jgi:hypothetical protein
MSCNYSIVLSNFPSKLNDTGDYQYVHFCYLCFHISVVLFQFQEHQYSIHGKILKPVTSVRPAWCNDKLKIKEYWCQFTIKIVFAIVCCFTQFQYTTVLRTATPMYKEGHYSSIAPITNILHYSGIYTLKAGKLIIKWISFVTWSCNVLMSNYFSSLSCEGYKQMIQMPWWKACTHWLSLLLLLPYLSSPSSQSNYYNKLPSYGTTAQIGPWPPLLRFPNHTQLDIHGRTPLDKWSAHRRGLYLHRKTQHISTRQTTMPSAGFEPAIPATKRLQTYALEHMATGIGTSLNCSQLLWQLVLQRQIVLR